MKNINTASICVLASLLLFSTVASYAQSVDLVDSNDPSQWEGLVVVNSQITHSKENSFELFGKYATELTTKRMIPIDMKKTYTLSAWLRTLDPNIPACGNIGLRMYDKDKREIKIAHVNAFVGTESKLVSDALKGAKEFFIEKNPIYLEIKTVSVAFNAKDDYSDLPNYNLSPRVSKIVDNGENYKVILSAPMPKSYKAGTKIRLHQPWGAPLYWLKMGWYPPEWTNVTNTMKGEAVFGTPIDKFWHGTKYVRVFVWFGNWNLKPKDGAKLLVSDIDFIQKD